MSVEIIAQVFRRFPHGGGMRLLALALADCANPDGSRIFPSVDTLAAMSMQSERSVQRQLTDLLAEGWLILVRKSTGRRGDCTEYRISPEWLAGGVAARPDAPPDRRTAPAPTGDKLAPVPPVDNSRARVTSTTPRVTPEVVTGDTAMSPNPSLTVIEPIPPYPPSGGVHKFDELVSEYPRKSHLSKAAEAYRRLAPDDPLHGMIIVAVRCWARSPEWQREDGRYVPLLHKWLRERRWNDVPGYTARPLPAPAPMPPAEVLTPEQLAANAQRIRELRSKFGPRKVVASC